MNIITELAIFRITQYPHSHNSIQGTRKTYLKMLANICRTPQYLLNYHTYKFLIFLQFRNNWGIIQEEDVNQQKLDAYLRPKSVFRVTYIWQSLLSGDRIKSGVLKFSFPVQNTTQNGEQSTFCMIQLDYVVFFRPQTGSLSFKNF